MRISDWSSDVCSSDLARTEAGAGPAEMRLQDLADIHAAWHTERIEHDIDRLAVLEVRHVLERHDLGNDALVAVTPGHLVAWLQLALHRDEHLDHLHAARRQFFAALPLLDLRSEKRRGGKERVR